MENTKLKSGTYERLCQQGSVGIVLLDLDFNILMINDSACRHFDVKMEEAVNNPIETIIPKHRHKITRKLLTRSVELTRSLEYRIRYTKSGKKKYLAIIIDPIKNSGNEVDVVCLWVRDLSRRMELEKRLARVDKFVSLGQMAGGVAHHFNSVLGGIVTAIDFALQSNDPELYKQTLKLIMKGIGKAVDLTQRLLEFSVPEKPEQDLADLTEVIIAFVEKEEAKLAEKRIKLELEIKSAPILAVHPGKMRQILQILMINSLEAMEIVDGGEIKITIDSDEKYVKVLFSDTGPGIAKEVADKIFEPFFTTRGSISGGSRGNLGLGLTVAKRLADDIGGDISYTPEQNPKGKGACFTIAFPIPHKTMKGNEE